MPFVCFNITNTQPLRIGTFGSSTTQKSKTLEYISASSLRGAFMNALYKEFGADADDCLTKILFYNAYPKLGKKVFFPTPLHLRVDKHKWREASITDSDVKLSNLSSYETTIENAINHLEYKFLNIERESISGYKVKKSYTTHHAKYKTPDEKGESNNLFRYESISANQTFHGIIYCPDDKIGYIDYILLKGTIYIGSSKNSGYGKCILTSLEKCSNLILDDSTTFDNTITIRALSDCIFKDKFGMPTNMPNEDMLKSYFGNISLKNAFIHHGVTEGYNTKWRLRMPKETTATAGSVWIYNLEEPEKINLKTVRKFENELHGEKKWEGYGWLQVMRKHSNTFMFIKHDSVMEFSNIRTKIKGIDFNKHNNLNKILSNILSKKGRWISKIAYGEIDNTICKVNNTLLRNMIERIELIEDESSHKRSKEWITKNKPLRDKNMFCFKGCDFEEIFEYLLVGSSNYDKLNTFVECHVPQNSDSKSLMLILRTKFDENACKKSQAKKTFLRDVLSEILYHFSRISEKESESERGNLIDG